MGDNQLVNAWLFLNEDEPQVDGKPVGYDDPQSCYQTLIRDGVYQAVDVLFLCFIDTIATGPNTIPTGDGTSCTLHMDLVSHPDNATNLDYLKWVNRDAKNANPNIKVAVTLLWGNEDTLKRVFTVNPNNTDKQNAENFAANLVAYLEEYDLDGFDIDWEEPLSSSITKTQFKYLADAIGSQFRSHADKGYLFTMSPASVGTLDAAAVNADVDFVTLQLYSGFTTKAEFVQAGINEDLLAYGAKFESNYQTAEQAYAGAKQGGYRVITQWRLNSSNFAYEQSQQKKLYQLVKGGEGFRVDVPAGPIYSNDDAKTKAPLIAAAHGGTWTGQWKTVVQGEMSVVQLEFPSSQGSDASFTLDVPAGPIYSNDDAKTKAPVVAASYNGEWHGQWKTIVEGKMSVIGVNFAW